MAAAAADFALSKQAMSYALCKHLERDPVTPLRRSLPQLLNPFFFTLEARRMALRYLLLFNGHVGVFFPFLLVRTEMF
jgi:hypothetical protein